jgi:predicted ferric reductase
MRRVQVYDGACKEHESKILKTHHIIQKASNGRNIGCIACMPQSTMRRGHKKVTECSFSFDHASKMKFAARIISFVCFSWVLLYVLFGGTAGGKTFFKSVAHSFFSDDGGVAIITLAIPILLSGSVCSLLLLRQPESPVSRRTVALPYQLPSFINRWLDRFHNSVRGDEALDGTAFLLIGLPCLIYTVSSIHRHLYKQNKSLDDQIMDVGNVFAMVAEITLAIFLIPVARHSSILHLVGWSPASAVRLHIWSGRIVVIGVLIHGAAHMIRWKALAGERLVSMLVPPAGCWTMANDSTYEPICVDKDTDCSCYHHFRNLTGFIAALGLILIGGTSLHSVRRRSYALFYNVHVIAGPMVLLLTILHWNKSILYMAPSIIYYIASSFPVMMEGRSTCRRQEGVKIAAVEQVLESETTDTMGNNSASRTCISLTMYASDAAMQRYRSMSYIKLLVPEVSAVSHPFSVNTVPGQSNLIRIVFRVTGPFTRQLANRLLSGNSPSPTSKMPILYADGYYGSPDRVSQVLSHDVVVIVAGGIGITPYLSLLHTVYSKLSHQSHLYPTRAVHLHWICRDESLIDYMTREYFDPLLQKPNDAGFQIRIILHRTAVVASETKRVYPPLGDMESQFTSDDRQLATESVHSLGSGGVPFTPSRFAPGSKKSYIGNLPSFLSFSTIAWIGLVVVWYFYTNVQSTKEVFSRVWSPIFIIVLGGLVAVAVNISSRYGWDDSDAPLRAEWSAVELKDLRSLPDDTAEENDGLGLDSGDGVIRTVTIEEKEGRPTVHHLMNSLNEAKQPGLFACGPALLMQKLRATTKERCLVRCRQCLPGDSQIALYEEAFEI